MGASCFSANAKFCFINPANNIAFRLVKFLPLIFISNFVYNQFFIHKVELT